MKQGYEDLSDARISVAGIQGIQGRISLFTWFLCC